MTALLLTPDQSAGLLAAVAASYKARGMAPYWMPLPLPVRTGKHAGMIAVDVGPEALGMEMRDGLTLEELPDFAAIMKGLGNPVPVELGVEDVREPASGGSPQTGAKPLEEEGAL